MCAERKSRRSLDQRALVFDLVFCAALLIVATWYAIRNIGCALDDSYITYQYAANAAEGNGLAFNVGERHYGSTAMGQAVALAALGRVLSSGLSALPFGRETPTPREFIPTIAVALSALALATMSLVWLLIVRRLPTPAGSRLVPVFLRLLLVVLTAYLFIGFPSNFVAGHETCVFVALLFVGAYASFFADRLALAGVVVAVATMTRPDGALFAGVLGGAIAIRTQILAGTTSSFRAALRFGTAYLAILVPWIAFLWITFGSPIPDTMTAKRAQVLLGHWPLFTLDKAVRTLAENLPTFLGALILAAGLSAVARRRLLTRGGFVRAFTSPLVAYMIVWGSFAVGLIAAYWSFGVTFWRWYVYPIHYAVLGIALPAAWVIASDTHHRHLRWALSGAVVAVFLLIDSSPFLKTAKDWATLKNENLHTAVNGELAAFISEAAPDGALIATSEPGNLAYRLGSRYRVVDTIGLTSPGVSRAIVEGKRDYAFQAWKPDFVVDSWRVATSPVALPWFSTRYELVGEFRNAYWARYLNRGVYLYGVRGRTSIRHILAGDRAYKSPPAEIATVLETPGVNRCAVERIQDTPIRAAAKTEVSQRELLRISGWAMDTGNKLPPKRVFLRFTSASTNYYVETSIRIVRDDLVTFFKDSGFRDSGWQTSVDLTTIDPGEYDVDLLLLSTTPSACKTGQRVEIREG